MTEARQLGRVTRGALCLFRLRRAPRPRQRAEASRSVSTAGSTPPFDRQLWGVGAGGREGQAAVRAQPRRLFTPASNTKLVVSAVAAALLPPDWTVQTSLYAAGAGDRRRAAGRPGALRPGRPDAGPPLLRDRHAGEGACDTDPFTRLRELADTLRARGVREVRGDLVGDGSWFEPATVHPGWELFDLNWWYAAPVSGLGFNDNSVDFTWRPGATVGAPARDHACRPTSATCAFENRTVTVPRGRPTRTSATGSTACRARSGLGRRARSRSTSRRAPSRSPCRTRTSSPRGPCGRRCGRRGSRSPAPPARPPTRCCTGRRAAAPPLAEVTSRPLRDWIFPILNTSQNWFAEMLLKQLGRQFGQAGSWEEGLARGAPVPDRLGEDRLDRVLAAGRLRALQRRTW